MKVLTIKQPFAWLIVNGHKDVENRVWKTDYRGPLLIHAAKTLPPDFAARKTELEKQHGISIPDDLPRGGIVGKVEVVDCVEADTSKWFKGPFGFKLKHARRLPFRPCRGQLGLFSLPQ